MGTVVLKLDAHVIKEMKNYYKNHLVEAAPQGAIFVAKPPGCTITAYKSRKVLFQGKNSEGEGKKWGRQESTPKKNKETVSSLPEGFADWSVIGSDEVGTGDYFGPITVVAAFVNKEQIPLIKQLEVQDSKNLTDEKIVVIAKQLKDVISYSLLTLHNEKYNELQQSGMSQGKMKALLHNQAINHVLEKIAPKKPDGILIDQFAKKEVYYQYLKNTPNVCKDNVYFHTQAEGLHIAVAAASILARYAFIQHMDRLSEKAGFSIPKGAGSTVDKAAARLIKEKGEEALPYFVKLHFANTKKAIKIAENKL